MKKKELKPIMLSVADACNQLGISKRTLQIWDNDGKINCHRTIGGHRRVYVSEIERILKEGEKK
jgi:excisionase family DNA binding protein